MTASVLALQPGRLDLGVNLRRREAGVPEKLLNCAEIGSALEQMGREGVAQGMGRDAAGDRRLADPALQPPANVGWVKATTALGDKQGILVPVCYESASRPLQVTGEGRLGGLAHRHQPGLRTLAL